MALNVELPPQFSHDGDLEQPQNKLMLQNLVKQSDNQK